MNASGRDVWRPARLLPTVGIRGQEEQERRATSALLAVMRAVPEFGTGLLKELGAPKSMIQTFCEVRVRDPDGRLCIPDGAIVCERGRRSWTCLVEVKTGSAHLRDEQVATYLDVARENGFDAVLTISNQITADSTETPVVIDGRKLRKQDLGEDVAIVRSRRQTTASRLEETTRTLVSEGHLTGSFRIPGAIGDVTLRADLRTRQTMTSVTFAAPSETRPRTRITWLLRQLREAPGDLRIDASYKNVRQTVAGLLGQVAETPDLLLCEQDPRRDLKSFTLTLSRRLGQKRGREEGSFVRETRHQLVDFYGDLVQNLKPWQAPAPKLRERDDEPLRDEPRPTALRSPADGGNGASMPSALDGLEVGASAGQASDST